jgi:formiminotetrahydrofolate cyclodeaminase
VATSLVDSTLQDVLSAFAAAVPTPGGGSACATASAMGVALLIKAGAVAGVPPQTLGGIEAQLVDAIDGDARAFGDVIAAHKQPRDGQAERAQRATAIQSALRHATDVPLRIMRLSAEALTEAHALAPRIRRSTIADVTVAVMLLRAAFEGARTIVVANLSGLADARHATTVRDECDRLSEQAERSSGEAERLLRAV